jgi:hypothetical protein
MFMIVITVGLVYMAVARPKETQSEAPSELLTHTFHVCNDATHSPSLEHDDQIPAKPLRFAPVAALLCCFHHC